MSGLKSAMLVWLLMLIVGGSVRAVAVQSDPAAGRMIPDPSECMVAPRSVEELLSLTERSAIPSETSEPNPTAPALLHDEPVEPKVVDAVTATAREIVACINAGDPRRLYALFGDDLVRLGADIDPAELAAPPTPLPDGERVAFHEVSFVRPLSDGRVGAVLVIDDPAAPSPVEAFFAIFAFAQADDRWILDALPDPYVSEVDTNVGARPPDEATPES